MRGAATFRLFLWPHRLLLLGPSFAAEIHRHHAAQLSAGLEGSLAMRSAEHEAWKRAPTFLVPPDVPHGFDASGGACALLYLDPESTEWAGLRQHYPENHLQAMQGTGKARRALQQLYRLGGPIEEAERACRLFLGSAAPQSSPALDPRLVRALEWVGANLDRGISLAEVAGAAGVSESWLSHRFGEAIGIPLRRYVLWLRVRVAMQAALRGATLTEAAQAAGLSDSAHLARSFRDMFGVPPSFLVAPRCCVDFQFAAPGGNGER